MRETSIISAIVALLLTAFTATPSVVAAAVPPFAQACDESYKTGIMLDPSGPGVEQDLPQKVTGDDTNDLVKADADLKAKLAALAGFSGTVQGMRLVIMFGSKNRGLGSLSVRSFLDGVKSLEDVDPVTPGHADNAVVPKGKLIAYYYDETKTDKSCMQVEMTVQITRGKSGDMKELKYRVHVFGDFDVKSRDDTDVNDVFPGTPVAISQDTAAERDFFYKLWANGNSIQVTRAEWENPGGIWVTFPPSDAIYAIDSQSCIDMMFMDPPPETLPSTAAPPAYCLGRCTTPPIVNTGV